MPPISLQGLQLPHRQTSKTHKLTIMLGKIFGAKPEVRDSSSKRGRDWQ